MDNSINLTPSLVQMLSISSDIDGEVIAINNPNDKLINLPKGEILEAIVKGNNMAELIPINYKNETPINLFIPKLKMAINVETEIPLLANSKIELKNLNTASQDMVHLKFLTIDQKPITKYINQVLDGVKNVITNNISSSDNSFTVTQKQMVSGNVKEIGNNTFLKNNGATGVRLKILDVNFSNKTEVLTNNKPANMIVNPSPNKTGFLQKLANRITGNQINLDNISTGKEVSENSKILVGKVVDNSHKNSFMVSAGNSKIEINSGAKLPIGTNIKFEIVKTEDIGQYTIQPTMMEPLIFGECEDLDLLLNIKKLLSSHDMGGEKHNILKTIPRTNSDNMVSNIINYMRAVNHNDISLWFGNHITKALKKMGDPGKDILHKAGKELDDISAKLNRVDGEAKIYEIPLFNEAEIKRIKVVAKKFEYKPNKKAKKEVGTRFIINTHLSKMGDIQFDGMAFEKSKKFDLILRCENDFGEVRNNKIKEIFTTSLEALNYVGNIMIKSDEVFADINEKQIMDEGNNQGIFV